MREPRQLSRRRLDGLVTVVCQCHTSLCPTTVI